jgi:PD-(D/E)XK endonuclease
MNLKKNRIPPKELGEFAELAFAFKAAQEGFSISKPYGDSKPYDFVIDNSRKLLKSKSALRATSITRSTVCSSGAAPKSAYTSRARSMRWSR